MPADESAPIWPVARRRQWPQHLGRFLIRVDVLTLLVTAAGVVIAYLTLVQPH